MNKIALITTTLFILIIGIGCACAADLDVNDSSLSSGLGGGGDNGPFYASAVSSSGLGGGGDNGPFYAAKNNDRPQLGASADDLSTDLIENDDALFNGRRDPRGLDPIVQSTSESPVLGSGLGGGGAEPFY